MKQPLRIALLYWQASENATLSYQHGWPRAFQESPLFDAVPLNLANAGWGDRLALLRILTERRFDAIVMLHSVFSNQPRLRRLLFWLVARCPQPKAFFIGNEYKSMPEKIRFCREIGLSLLITQSNDPRVLTMYSDAIGCAVDSVPNTGYDPTVFRPGPPLAERPIDIGYRSFEAPWYLGNNEKTEIADYFQANAAACGFKVDISLAHDDRFDMAGYAAFLNRCRGQLGTESGGDYFELTDALRDRTNAFLRDHVQATWPEVRARFFDSLQPTVPMRIISGRQVEAAACKTAQVLFEGRYNGYLEPDVHYIPLAKDFGNIDDVVRKLHDDAYCTRVVNNAYDVAMSELTYDRLTAKFAAILSTVV